MIPQTVPPYFPRQTWCDEVAAFADKWGLSFELAQKLSLMAARAPFPIRIISGYRSQAAQEGLLAKPDSTAAPVDRSNHTVTVNGCPASRAADVEPQIAVTEHVKALLGEAGVIVGLRWGGGAPVDSGGIPVGVEWRHFDLGPRP